MKNKKGFTLVELLVVIAIIGILIGMLLPAVQQVREAARRTTCMNHIRQQSLAVLNYESTFEAFPPGWQIGDPLDAESEPGWGWSAYILPYIEMDNIHNQINFNEAIDDHDHEDVIREVIPVYLCPSQVNATEIVNLDTHIEEHAHRHNDDDDDDDHDHGEELLVGRSDYSGVFGSTEIEDSPLDGNGVFYAGSAIEFRNIYDGSSNTLMIGERVQHHGSISWVGMVPEVAEPMARIVGGADHAPNDTHDEHFEDFRSDHPGGIVTALCDGSSHFVNENISEEVFQALATRNAGEVIATVD